MTELLSQYLLTLRRNPARLIASRIHTGLFKWTRRSAHHEAFSGISRGFVRL